MNVPCANKKLWLYPSPLSCRVCQASRWLPARVHNARRSGRMVHTLSICLPTKDDTPVTPHRGPCSARTHGKRRKKAQINTPTMEESEAPPQPRLFKKQSDSSSTTRGWYSSSERSSSSPQWDSSIESDRSQASVAESERSSYYELRTTTPDSYEDETSQESMPQGQIDTQPVGTASIRAERAYPWRRYVKRKVQDSTEEEKILHFQEN
jgi:hypothetical protein